jgi:hypothetical protein
MDQLTDDDQEWARDLFGKARDGEESAWTADAVAIGRAGDRRRLTRSLGVGGGALGVVAVTAAVAVGIAGGPTSKDPGKIVGPVSSSGSGGWNGRPLAQVLDYLSADPLGSKSNKQGAPDFVVPQSVLQDGASILGTLDPELAHVRTHARPDRDSVVVDTDPRAEDLSGYRLSGIWTTDGVAPTESMTALADPTTPSGTVDIYFASNSEQLGVSSYTKPDTSLYNTPCGFGGLSTMDAFMATPPEHEAHWSTCDSRMLPDGSKVDTTWTPDGTGKVFFTVRQFPGDKGGVIIVVRDYPRSMKFKPSADGDKALPPDDVTVLKPSPFSEDLLRKALSGPSVKLGLTPDAKPDAPSGFLKADDLGADWTTDPALAHGSTDELPMDNGCTPDHSIFNLAAGRAAGYLGKLPNGQAGAVFEGEYKLAAGTGAKTFQQARSLAQGGCDPTPQVRFSKNTVADLPAGIGDGAYVQYDHGNSSVRVTIRFGDTIVQTDITEPGTTTVPDLSSPQAQAWLTHVAQQIAARWAGK